jgi:predicted DCC family thiol-disulfide oxidoreductase YuxK
MVEKDSSEKILIFDGICLLCNSSVNFLYGKVKNRNYKFIASQSDEGKEIITKYQLDDLPSKTIVLIKDGIIFIKSRALLEVADDMPLIWRMFKVFKIIPLSLRDYFYDLISKYRYTIFGKI